MKKIKKCKYCDEDIILGLYEGKEMILSEGFTRNQNLKKIKKFFPHSCGWENKE